MVKWYTRTLEVRMPKGVEVQVLSWAQIILIVEVFSSHSVLNLLYFLVMKTLKRCISIFLLVVFCSILILSTSTALLLNLNSVGKFVGVENFGVKLAEKVIDSNQNFWTTYQNQRISFLYPMYLSYFENISATGLTAENVTVAHYLRRPDDSRGSLSSRSYWISLMQMNSFFKTQDLDVEAWIQSNRFNIKNYDCESCDSKDVLPIEKVSLGGREAYSVKVFEDGMSSPRIETIYFQTSEGIKSLGFLSISPNTLDQDYLVYQKIISTVTFL